MSESVIELMHRTDEVGEHLKRCFPPHKKVTMLSQHIHFVFTCLQNHTKNKVSFSQISELSPLIPSSANQITGTKF